MGLGVLEEASPCVVFGVLRFASVLLSRPRLLVCSKKIGELFDAELVSFIVPFCHDNMCKLPSSVNRRHPVSPVKPIKSSVWGIIDLHIRRYIRLKTMVRFGGVWWGALPPYRPKDEQNRGCRGGVVYSCFVHGGCTSTLSRRRTPNPVLFCLFPFVFRHKFVGDRWGCWPPRW